MKNIFNWKRIRFFVLHYDFIWSFPLFIFTIWNFGILMRNIFGQNIGVYDLSFMHPGLISGSIALLDFGFSCLFLSIFLRYIWKYIFGVKLKDEFGNVLRDKDGNVMYKNWSLVDWKQIKPLQRLLIANGWLVFIILVILVIYLKLI